MVAPHSDLGPSHDMLVFSVAGARLIHRRRRFRAAVDWVSSAMAIWYHRFGDQSGGCTAANLLGSALAESTTTEYAGHWRRFVNYCRQSLVSSLSATAEIIASYLGDLFNGTCIAGCSLHYYLEPIRHRRIQLAYVPSPTNEPIVKLVQNGYRREDRGLRDAPTRHLPLLAPAALGSLECFLATSKVTIDSRGDAAVAAGFLMMAWPMTVLALCKDNTLLSPSKDMVRIRVYKSDGAG